MELPARRKGGEGGGGRARQDGTAAAPHADVPIMYRGLSSTIASRIRPRSSSSVRASGWLAPTTMACGLWSCGQSRERKKQGKFGRQKRIQHALLINIFFSWFTGGR